MPSQTKRAAVAAKEPKAKRQQEDPLVCKCNGIISVLASAEGCSSDTLHMLAGAVKSCLIVPKEERHEVQNAVIEMIAEVLTNVERGHTDRVAVLRGRIAQADAEKAERVSRAEAAVEVCIEKFEAVAGAEKVLEEAKEKIVAIEDELKVIISEQKAGDADLEEAVQKKASAHPIVSMHLPALTGGTAADIAESLKMVMKVGKDLGLEDQLLASATCVLSKLPAERGSFDSIVVQQVDEQINIAINKLSEKLNMGEAGKVERAEKVELCKNKLDNAVASKGACEEALQAAKSALKEAEATKDSSEKAVSDLGPEMEAIAASAETADALLVACKADLATFWDLVEGKPDAPEAISAEADDKATIDAAMPQA